MRTHGEYPNGVPMCGRRFATDRPQSDNPSLLESPTVKVFISVDMEGISGLVRWADVY